MGSGFKDFSAGDVLTSTDVDGYLMRQTIMTFASTSARDTALSGVLDEGMFCYTEDTNSVWFYSGSAWVRYSSAWTSFTPSYNNLTIGNGTNTGMYRYQSGDLRQITKLTWGSTTSISNTVTIDVVNSESASSLVDYEAWGTLHCRDDSAGIVRQGGAFVADGSSTIGLHSDITTGFERVDASYPFVWATSDVMRTDIVVPL